MTRPTWDQLEGGVFGLLVGDALGVPYEFHKAEDLPAFDRIDMVPPATFLRSYGHVPLGTWSDDGAQALSLFDSLLSCGGWDPADFAARLLAWYRQGTLAVDGKVFDVGIQTGAALDRLGAGVPPLEAGLAGERNNGNGSLMRTLPVALLHEGDDASLVGVARAQSLVTHAHPRAQTCCALYALWARYEIHRAPDPWKAAVTSLRSIVHSDLDVARELDGILSISVPPRGTGYVVDSLLSARFACRHTSFEDIVRQAVALGHDTDTTACLAGGIAGIRHGVAGIPAAWLSALRGRTLLNPLLQRARARIRRI